MLNAMAVRESTAVREPRTAVRKNKPEMSDVGLFFRYYGSAFNDVVISLCVPCREFVAAATSMDLLMAVEQKHVCVRDRR
jgi:hypothetical protein